MKETLVAELKFQAQVDAEYQRHGRLLLLKPDFKAPFCTSTLQGLLAFMPLSTLPLVALHSRSQH